MGSSETWQRGSMELQTRDRLRTGALLTAAAAVLFPRLNAVLHDGQALWELDAEAAAFIPIIIGITLVIFATLGRWSWRVETSTNRAARTGLVCGILGLLGIVAFWISAPIIFGGLALTLGLEAVRRATLAGRRGEAVAATTLGAVAVLTGAGIWIVGL